MSAAQTLSGRSAGVLLHMTSLPGVVGGDCGPAARAWVDQLADAGVRWWQMLPTHPIGAGYSPYASPSAFAWSSLVISGEDLLAEGLLTAGQWRALSGRMASATQRGGWWVDYGRLLPVRREMLRLAYAAFGEGRGELHRAFERYRRGQAGWLDVWSVFAALRELHGERAWTTWRGRGGGGGGRGGDGYALAGSPAVREFAEREAELVRYHAFVQFLADRQWARLREYAAVRGVGLIGDLPIFVSHDSADVWGHRELFRLDRSGRPVVVTGVPPDLFSRTGQRWGHPHYDWRRHEATGFAWWASRFARLLSAFDVVRIDHFLGFYRTWAIPGTARTAVRGRWVLTPGQAIFDAAEKRVALRGRVIAEDLGIPTKGAEALRRHMGFPGMKVLQFGFGGGSEHRPLAYERNTVAYTGTHDNDTSAGYLASIRRNSPREWAAAQALGVTGGDAVWRMISSVADSPAETAVVPAQDLLGLDGRHRMNLPGTVEGNWRWRLARPVPGGVWKRLRELLEVTVRVARAAEG